MIGPAFGGNSIFCRLATGTQEPDGKIKHFWKGGDGRNVRAGERIILLAKQLKRVERVVLRRNFKKKQGAETKGKQNDEGGSCFRRLIENKATRSLMRVPEVGEKRGGKKEMDLSWKGPS